MRVVLTGGPGAGKTAVLELVRQHFCRHVHVLPEAASILFTGGFPRSTLAGQRSAVQRAIFWVQRELEAVQDAAEQPAITLCDRGTIDGAAYWPGPGTLWSAVGTTLAAELGRYDAVIHLRTPGVDAYDHSNPVRIESALEAAEIDERIASAWSSHPRRFFVESATDFMTKAQHAIDTLRAQLPACCRVHHVPRGPGELEQQGDQQ
ncbi:MAG: ATP-binding protein [Myxococcales bacterium]|nr:ATP-binding protein [Myxococcales bacterium]